MYALPRSSREDRVLIPDWGEVIKMEEDSLSDNQKILNGFCGRIKKEEQIFKLLKLNSLTESNGPQLGLVWVKRKKGERKREKVPIYVTVL